ncbi:MAG: Xaa-Pro peptidase family protein [Alphaproteobacteria bacterium]|jgi:Xaa-Pro dipeptidase|nr:aminopeptidase P family protein [Rhodospirillaceae bacterium]MDG2480866.1 Xaa-Pro peptidase family protein [Alphaproteobacteria bacterium]
MGHSRVAAAQVVQYGAMEGSIPPTDLDKVRRDRLANVHRELRNRDLAGAVLLDQLNVRYATDATNMQVWCLHNEVRYCFVATDGPCILFDFSHVAHLSDGLPGVTERRPARGVYYMGSGSRMQEHATEFARQIADLVREHGGGNKRIAFDRSGPDSFIALQNESLELHDGFEMMEEARKIKTPEEIILMRHSINSSEKGIQAMRDYLRPGITENALWAKLHEVNIAEGGEWIETRLLASGPRTNPWMSECSMRVIEKGDMVSFDTDLIGPYGYCSDISRAWVCDAQPSNEQRRLYMTAMEQLEHNRELVKPGLSFREWTDKAWKMPDEFVANRYGVIAHGVGLVDEYPAIYFPQDYEANGYDDYLVPGMVVCVEALIGSEGGRECVKLEQQVLVTETGYERLDSFPMDETWN